MGYRNVPPVIFGCHIPHVYPIAEHLHARLHNLLFTSPFYNWLAGGVRAFHVINNSTLGILSRQFPKRRVQKIYYPFDFDAFAADADKFPFDGRFDKGKFNLVWIGRLVEQKGVHDLVRLIDRSRSPPSIARATCSSPPPNGKAIPTTSLNRRRSACRLSPSTSPAATT